MKRSTQVTPSNEDAQQQLHQKPPESANPSKTTTTLQRLEQMLENLKKQKQQEQQKSVEAYTQELLELQQNQQQVIGTPAQYFSPDQSYNRPLVHKFPDQEIPENNQNIEEEKQIHQEEEEEENNEIVEPDETFYEAQSHGTNQNSDESKNLWTIVGLGIRKMVFMPLKGIEYIMDGGQKSNKNQMKKLMMKNKDTTSFHEIKKESSCYTFIVKIGVIIQHYIMPMIILSSSCCLLMNLVIWSYFKRGYLQSEITQQYLTYSDYSLVVLFFFELCFNIRVSIDVDEIFDFENALLLLYSGEILWVNLEYTQYDIVNFMHALRSLRIYKLKYVTKLFTYYIDRYISNLNQDDLKIDENYIDEEGEMSKFILNELIGFMGGILLEASLLLALDKSLDFTGFYPYTPDNSPYKFDYLSSSYFVIVSFSTIGYGDIFPVATETKLVMIVLLIINITVMSSFLGKFIEHIFQLSPFNQYYDFKDHAIIVGNLEWENVVDLLEEIVETDLVERNLRFVSQLAVGIKVIIVVENDPNSSFNLLAQYLSEKHDNEIVFLKENIFSSHKKWYKKANIIEAKVLFLLSQDQSSLHHTYLMDQQLSILAQAVREDFPTIRIQLILNSDFKKQVDMDSYFKDIDTISQRQMNELLLATSVENPGLLTTFQHLFTMKVKNVGNELVDIIHSDQFLFSYLRDMQSEIYQVKIPDFFVGMPFRKLAQLLYLSDVQTDFEDIDENNLLQNDRLLGNEQITLFAVETLLDANFNSMQDDESQSSKNLEESRSSNQNIQHTNSNNMLLTGQKPSLNKVSKQSEQSQDSNVFFNALKKLKESKRPKEVQKKENINDIDKFKTYKTQILINPQNYNIRKNDIVFMICNNHDQAKEIAEIKNQENVKIKTFKENQDQIKKCAGSYSMRNSIILDLFKDKELEKQKICQNNSNMQLNKSDKMQKQFFNFFDFEFPDLQFSQHIVILAKFTKQQTIIANTNFIVQVHQLPSFESNPKGLQYFTLMRIWIQHNGVIYAFNSIKFTALRETTQISITLNIYKFKMLIDDEEFPDAIGICFSRILIDLYDFYNYIIELEDNSSINLLNKNPKLKNLPCPSFVQQSFLQGSVYFKQTTHGVLARAVYNQNWLRLFQELVLSKQNTLQPVNNTVNCIKLSKTAAEGLKYFGILQYSLLEMQPSLIAVLLVKEKLGSKFQEMNIKTLKKNQKFKKIYEDFIYMEMRDNPRINKQEAKDRQNASNRIYDRFVTNFVQKVLGREIGQRFILTNPSFYTPIEENDQVVIIGTLSSQNEENCPTSRNEENEEAQKVKRKYENCELRINVKESLKDEFKRRIKRINNFRDLL